MRDLGRLLQKMKPVAVEQRFVPCQVPFSPLIYFLTVGKVGRPINLYWEAVSIYIERLGCFLWFIYIYIF